MTEFALCAPLLFGAGLAGIETANQVITQMQVSQVAIHIADNVSRAGEQSALGTKTLYESDIDDVLVGANIQAGQRIDLYEHGRVIISSLESFDRATHCSEAAGCPSGPTEGGDQFIHWQRCMGKKRVTSSYGMEDAVLPDGIGPDEAKVLAPAGGAVIFVEVRYEYQPLMANFLLGGRQMSAIASFVVRDDRDLSGIKQRDEDDPDVTAECSGYTDLDVFIA